MGQDNDDQLEITDDMLRRLRKGTILTLSWSYDRDPNETSANYDEAWYQFQAQSRYAACRRLKDQRLPLRVALSTNPPISCTADHLTSVLP